MKRASVEQGSDLCVGCGMCCDGSIFANATVEPGEEERMQSAGLNLFESDEKTYFHQPCPHSQLGRCAIYQNRFHICRTFECKLSSSLKLGAISLLEARQKIDFARGLIAQAVELEPEAASHSQRNVIRARLAKELAGADDGPAEQSSESLLRLVAVEVFLDRWFRHKKSLRDDTMRQSGAVDRQS